MRDTAPSEQEFERFSCELEEQFAESARLDAAIVYNLDELGYGG